MPQLWFWIKKNFFLRPNQKNTILIFFLMHVFGRVFLKLSNEVKGILSWMLPGCWICIISEYLVLTLRRAGLAWSVPVLSIHLNLQISFALFLNLKRNKSPVPPFCLSASHLSTGVPFSMLWPLSYLAKHLLPLFTIFHCLNQAFFYDISTTGGSFQVKMRCCPVTMCQQGCPVNPILFSG